MPYRLTKDFEICKSQPAEFLPRIFTDGTYEEAEHDLHGVFDATDVRRHATASVVIVYDGPDLKD